MASITVRSVDGEEKYYPLGKATVVIGRGEQIKVQVIDDLVSTKHLNIRFVASEGAYYAMDLKSKNGTRINGVRVINDLRLEDGDFIEIGASSITFHNREFPDKADAFKLHKKPGERDRTTRTRKN